MSTWQPIETAPKDGQTMLGWDTSFGGAVVSLMYIEDDPEADFLGEWMVCELHGDYIIDGFSSITHWMPLPTPPEATS